MDRKKLYVYGNWSAYDELSDGVPLTEELAMTQLGEVLRLRDGGARIDAYLMDAFWFAPEGGYRAWREPNWPHGPGRWLEACQANRLIPGLWFTANTLCHLEPAEAWNDSVDENRWGMCCFAGGFLTDYLDVLDVWYRAGVRLFKIDFADFSAAPPDLKKTLPPDEIRRRNVEAFRGALRAFRESHPEAMLMGFNGFEEVDYMARTDIPPKEPVLDLEWLSVFDSIYSGDPRPADLPAFPFWRSVDIYGDHTTRVLEASGVPLARIDNCGFMAGKTGTCYYRGAAAWKGMLLLTLARGGDLTVLYGDLRQFDDADAGWIGRAQALFESGSPGLFGGLPGSGAPYGWTRLSEEGGVFVAVNPSAVAAEVELPPAAAGAALLFRDAGFEPALNGARLTLAADQMAVFGTGRYAGFDLGVQEDVRAAAARGIPFVAGETGLRQATLEIRPTENRPLRICVRQRDAEGNLVRTYAGSPPGGASMASVLQMTAIQGERELAAEIVHDRVVWSGMSWGALSLAADAYRPGVPIVVEVSSADEQVRSFDFAVTTTD